MLAVPRPAATCASSAYSSTVLECAGQHADPIGRHALQAIGRSLQRRSASRVSRHAPSAPRTIGFVRRSAL